VDSRFEGNVAERNESLAWWLIQCSRNRFERNVGDATVGGDSWHISDVSTNNTFLKNTANRNAINGFAADTGSDNNRFFENTASENHSTGFASLTIGNVFTKNIANKNRADGFVLVEGNGTTLSANIAIQNANVGFVATNVTSGNTLATTSPVRTGCSTHWTKE
jgi:parallel beta-helix repeat protein